MGFLDKFIDRDKAAKATIADPREVFYNILKQTSGSSCTRELKYELFYNVIAFRGIVEGVGVSTIVSNVALAIAQLGLTVCVIDTSILSPVQDVLLKTSESVDSENDGQEHLDWFDMPYTRKSPLHVSKLHRNISVLSFKGKKHGVVDILSTNDSETLVDIAMTELHNKFDIVLIDSCHELTAVNTACLQQAQQIIQVWNDSPTVLASLENFITNSIVISCPLDKMRNVIYSRIVKDAMGSMDELCKQYRLKKIATSYTSEEISLLIVTGKTLYQAESTDQTVIDYTNCIIDIVCHLLNIRDDSDEPKGTITSNDIMDGNVEGTLHKDLKDFNEQFAIEHPEVVIETPDLGASGGTTYSLDDGGISLDDEEEDVADDVKLSEAAGEHISSSEDVAYNSTLEDGIEEEVGKKKKKLFGRRAK